MDLVEQRHLAAVPRFCQTSNYDLNEKKKGPCCIFGTWCIFYGLTFATQRFSHTLTSTAHSPSLKDFNRQNRQQKDLVR